VCPYCGTAFLDWSAFGIDKPNYIKIKLRNRVVLVKAYLSGLRVDYDPGTPSYLYANERPVECFSKPEVTLDAHLICFPFQLPGEESPVLSIAWDMDKADPQAAGETLNGIYKN
jgi:hypothetical protein